MPERSRKLGVGNVAHWRFAFHPDPSLHGIDRALTEKRHVVRRVQVLPPVLDAPAERVRGAQPLDQRLVDLGTSAAMPADPPQGLPFSPPLLEHLRTRLDELALDVGAAVARVARSG